MAIEIPDIAGNYKVNNQINDNYNCNAYIMSQQLLILKGKGQFKSVYFSNPNIPEQTIFKGVNFLLQVGQKLAIFGLFGKDKHFFLDVLGRFYDIAYGEILLDDKHINHYEINFLRKNVGYIFKKAILFETMILLENVKYGNLCANEDEIFRVLGLLNIPEALRHKDFRSEEIIKLMPDFRLKISIARALLKNSRILVYDSDEINSCIFDKKIRGEINDLIFENSKNKTLIFLTNDPYKIHNFDKIIIFNEGIIIEQGKHEDLLKLKGFYYNYYTRYKV